MILTYLPYFDVYTNIQNPVDCSPSDCIVHVFVVRRIYELQILLIYNSWYIIVDMFYIIVNTNDIHSFCDMRAPCMTV